MCTPYFVDGKQGKRCCKATIHKNPRNIFPPPSLTKSLKGSKPDTFQEHILVWGWEFMYDPVIPINMTLVREFYANRNQKNQREVYMRGRKIPCLLGDIERVLHPKAGKGK
ncbi:hypothetical protein PIB30_081517 [Stylosanthes scabra]|uniref:Uncharacterized protein n=1 Tax=Stylosanthes scabra TaxID=79078 RepID=A0ABU6QRD1_9FABA|nr:hypothetical protein [Stylosanthes scabra]